MKVIDKLSRKPLNEGRDRQMGFAFCKVKNENTIETVQPISPCKDYLNDVVWSEHTGKEIVVYGLKYKPIGIKDAFWYLVIKIQPTKYESGYKIDDDKKRLAKNYKNIVKILNYVEKLLKFSDLSKIYKSNDDIFILKVPARWCEYTYSISLYSLLVRMAQFYEDGTPEEFLENYSNNLDTGLWSPYKKKFKQILETGFKEQDMTKISGYTVHNEGFCTTKLWS